MFVLLIAHRADASPNARALVAVRDEDREVEAGQRRGRTVRDMLKGDETALEAYSPQCLSRVWNYQEFAVWLTETLHDAGDGVVQKLRDEVEDKIRELRTVLGSEDPAEIRNRAAELSVALQQIGQAMYAESGDGAGNGRPTDEDVTEGEYKVD